MVVRVTRSLVFCTLLVYDKVDRSIRSMGIFLFYFIPLPCVGCSNLVFVFEQPHPSLLSVPVDRLTVDFRAPS